MDFYDAVKARRSVRAYKQDSIPEDSIARIAEAVSLAPSACNLQPFKIILVLDVEVRKRICKVYSRDWLAQAPAIAVAIGDSSSAWKRLEGASIVDVDVAIAMEHFVLAAAAEGLGSCWVCAFDRDAMDSALSLRQPWRSVAVSPVGFADEGGLRELQRKPIGEVFQIVP